MNFVEQNISLEKCPALVLNADYRPLSYYPLSLWSWQDSIKSAFLDRVTIVSNYDRIIRSPSFSMKLPSVIALKSYIRPKSNPNFTRFNVFLRDNFMCQYCGSKKELTFDDTKSRFSYIMSRVDPTEAIDRLIRESDNNNDTSLFTFYEDSKGFHFADMEKLVEKKEVTHFTYEPSNYNEGGG